MGFFIGLTATRILKGMFMFKNEENKTAVIIATVICATIATMTHFICSAAQGVSPFGGECGTIEKEANEPTPSMVESATPADTEPAE